MNTPIIKSTHARRDMSGFDDHNLEFIIDGFKNGRHSDERLYVNALAEQGRRQHKGSSSTRRSLRSARQRPSGASSPTARSPARTASRGVSRGGR